jgi:GAF domain-containing protein
LERGVAERTRAIETSAEVSRRLSTILDQRQLVLAVVEEIQNAFNYYHTQIYLFDEWNENLVMVGGTGEAGQILLAQGHKIPSGRGLVGRAASTNDIVLVSDTTQDPNWLPNPLLPETLSEIAVPITLGNRVLGVIDVQHNILNGLSQIDSDLLSSIAAQVAVALQNAQNYTKAQQQAERETIINTIGQRIQTATTIEDVLQLTIRELNQSLNTAKASIQISGQPQPNGSQDSN